MTTGLQLRGITKRFGSVAANEDIDLDIARGEIHCLLGENGAGKSTLMNVLYGLVQPDAGQIIIDGTPVRISDPRAAMGHGIGMVHQHFMLVDQFTVAENLMLGREGSALGLLNLNTARTRVRELSERYHLAVDPDALVADLPVGIAQRVEIIKALAGDADYLIFDEPTAVLTPAEIDELIAVMRELRDEDKALVFITHKLGEVREVADKTTVIRRGRVVGEAEPGATEAELAELMVGREINLTVERTPAEPGKPRLDISGLSVAAPSGLVVVDNIDLEVRAGEILGIAGVQGNGQSELAEALVGLTVPTAGTITLDGADVTGCTPRQAIQAGIGYVPEERKFDGFVGPFSVAENLVLNRFRDPPYARGPAMSAAAITKNATERTAEFDIRAASIEVPVQALSGGNQQKVVLARELSRPLKLLIAAQPTRGVDVGAIEFLHARIVAERDRGTAVLLISTELDEILALSDRIAVMYRGRVVGIVPGGTGRDTLGLMMAGGAVDGG